MPTDRDKLMLARDLIRDKQFQDAREVLETIPDNPTAQQWLAQLDQRLPTAERAQLEQARALAKAGKIGEARDVLRGMGGNPLARQWLAKLERVPEQTTAASAQAGPGKWVTFVTTLIVFLGILGGAFGLSGVLFDDSSSGSDESGPVDSSAPGSDEGESAVTLDETPTDSAADLQPTPAAPAATPAPTAAPTDAPADAASAALPERYTSEDGSLAFDYPAGWTVQPFPSSVAFLMNDAALASTLTTTESFEQVQWAPGQVAGIVYAVPLAQIELGDLSATGGLNALSMARTMLAGMQAQQTDPEPGAEPVAITVIEEPATVDLSHDAALFAVETDQGSSVLFIVALTAEDAVYNLILFAPTGEIGQHRALALALADSIAYTPPVPAG